MTDEKDILDLDRIKNLHAKKVVGLGIQGDLIQEVERLREERGKDDACIIHAREINNSLTKEVAELKEEIRKVAKISLKDNPILLSRMLDTGIAERIADLKAQLSESQERVDQWEKDFMENDWRRK
jgi:predicted RNase H-like nuclease (RuvC/YqgF family)